MDRGTGGCQQAATHKVNRSTRAVGAAELAEIRRVSRTIRSILLIALPRLGQYYGEKIGTVCHYVRDVGVAGSNPVTQTTDFIRVFSPLSTYGSRSSRPTAPKTVPLSAQKIATRVWLALDVYEDPAAGFRVIGPI